MPYLSSLVSPVSTVSQNTDANPAPVILSSTDESIAEIAYYLSKLVKMSESLAVVDTAQRQRVVVESTAVFATPQPIQVRDTLGQTQFAIGNNSTTYWATIPEFWKFVEAARQNYQLSIRSNLQFT
ncbi:MAG: hypothetical protein EBU90_00495 [Proteobacteria bacterium]|nr:hypothetical protein [Pseudomonadota bacterium]NBP12910.1 hypothetical protein [bacterium]